MYAIEASHLSKRFRDIAALNDVSFTVNEGETFGYLGPNGAGKTTTIRILTGISPPTGGSASIFGHDIVNDTIAARQSMGVVSETSNVYDDLTAWQNMMFAAELYNIDPATRKKKAEELLSTFGLYGRRDRKAHGFSKGMKRRLTLAMGLVSGPRLLFLDEPTSGLDVESNMIIRGVITDLVRDGVTVFLTTHNIEEANLMCDRVAIINRGTIAAIDAPERLKKTIQSVQSIEVAFDRADAGTPDTLGRIPTVSSVIKEGDKFRIYTSDPSTVIEAVMDYARSRKLRVVSITTLGPTLEDVFIRITGLKTTGGTVHAID
ncbi:ATP-binding cassette domain-containing protein [Methanoregula sp. UBA64]|jgi:ABC-2 type transport system ATP-binding protein|uniref:ATP-binding cassette domain-containing protein n=1 Tax=Methanoregula sp. UBA64 TaxID=1915554 RepID=UPI0025FA16FD|nr:ATP-binding cassette domain-containing protein [Methanoregula sp. UBA64]